MNTILSKIQDGWPKPLGNRTVVFYKIMALWMVVLILFFTGALAAYGDKHEYSLLHAVTSSAMGVGVYAMIIGGLLFMLKVLKGPRKN